MNSFRQEWHCGADVTHGPSACWMCFRPETPLAVPVRNVGDPCPQCGIVGQEWCERWCPDGELCHVHRAFTRRHPLAPSAVESKRTARRYMVARQKRGAESLAAMARREAEDATHAAAASDGDAVNRHITAAKALLIAAQVAALDNAGAGAQTVNLSMVSEEIDKDKSHDALRAKLLAEEP